MTKASLGSSLYGAFAKLSCSGRHVRVYFCGRRNSFSFRFDNVQANFCCQYSRNQTLRVLLLTCN